MSILKSRLIKPLMIAGVAGLMTVTSVAQAAGDLTRRPQKLPDLVMGSDESDYYLSQKEYELETGKAYKLAIISNGQKEYAMVAPDFFASIFLEIRHKLDKSFDPHLAIQSPSLFQSRNLKLFSL